MKCWYFLFEGIFRNRSPKYNLKGVYSSAMVPAESKKVAKHELQKALKEYEIELVKIEDQFIFDPCDYDRDDPDNITWFSLFDEATRFKRVIFTPWEVFDDIED